MRTQEVDLGGHEHGHEVKSSVGMGHAAHQNNQHETAKYRQGTISSSFPTSKVELSGLRHGHDVHSSVSNSLNVKLFHSWYLKDLSSWLIPHIGQVNKSFIDGLTREITRSLAVGVT